MRTPSLRPSRRPVIDGSGEWVPALAAFTALMPLAYGAGAYLAVRGLAGPDGLGCHPPATAGVAALAVAARAQAAPHSPRARLRTPLDLLRRAPRSWMAREVVGWGAFAALASLAAALALLRLPWPAVALQVAALLPGGVALHASARLYALPSHPSWDHPYWGHWTWGTALLAALVTGGTLEAACGGSAVVRLALGWTALPVALALAVAWPRYLRTLVAGGPEARASHERYLHHRALLLARWTLERVVAALALVGGVVGAPVAVALWGAALACLAAAALIARLLFYRTAVPLRAPYAPGRGVLEEGARGTLA